MGSSKWQGLNGERRIEVVTELCDQGASGNLLRVSDNSEAEGCLLVDCRRPVVGTAVLSRYSAILLRRRREGVESNKAALARGEELNR